MSSLQKFHRRTNTTTIAYDTSTLLLLKGDKENNSTAITDVSSYSRNITNTSNITNSTTQYKYGISSIYFSSNKTLTPPTISLTDDFTIEGWFYQTTAVTTYMVFANGSHWFGWDGTATGLGVSSSNVVSLDLTNSWQHIAFVRASGVTSVYQNGKLLGTVSTVGTAAVNISALGSYGGSYGYNGYIDDFRISSVARYTADFIPPLSLTAILDITTDFYPYNVALLLKGNGTADSTTFTDSSGFAHTLTTTGNPKNSITQFKYGSSSAYFDGADYLTTPTNGRFDFGTGDFTIECWIYMGVNSNSYMIFTGGVTNSGNVNFGVNSSKLYFGGSGGVIVLTGTTTLKTNTWQHVAIVRFGTSLTSYIDGVLDKTVTDTNNYITTTEVSVGAYQAAVGVWDFKGYIDDLRVTKGVARYIKPFTPPLELPTCPPDPTLVLLNGNGSNGSTAITDSSAAPKTVSVLGNTQISTTQSKFGGSSIKFDGSGDYLQIPISTTSADITYESWIYYTTTANMTLVFDQRAGNGLMFYISAGNFTVGNNINGALIQATMPVAQNTWLHLAIVRAGGFVQVYINGVAVGTRAADATTGLSGTLWIGRFNDGYTGGDYLGYMDDFRVSATARYFGKFTPPTQLS